MLTGLYLFFDLMRLHSKKRQVITFGSCASMLRNGWRSRFALLLHSSEPALGFKIRGSGEKEVDFYLSQYI